MRSMIIPALGLVLLISCDRLQTQSDLASTQPSPEAPDTRRTYTYHPTELATIDESGIELVLHVDPAAADSRENADGSAARPFATLAAAAGPLHEALGRGVATKLVIAPGEYRENLRNLLNFPNNQPTIRQTLLVVEGASRDAVILSGSVTELRGHDFAPEKWRAVPGHQGLYEHDWPFEGYLESGPWMDSYGFALLPGLMQRTEMLWIDGKRPRQVLAERYRWHDPDGPRRIIDYGPGTTDPNEENQPGRLIFDGLSLRDPAGLTEPMTFAVYTDPAAPEALRGKVFLRLAEGQTMSDVGRIEVGWWKGRPWTPMLLLQNKDNVVLRNLTIRHGAMGSMVSAVNIKNCENFIIEDLDVSDNTATGLSITDCRRGIVRRVRANDNGSNGLTAGGSSHILFEDCETSFNNYRGAWAGWIAWHASAFKSGGVRNITVRRHTSIGNYANGIWYDVYCRDVLVEDSLFVGNRRMGVMFELTRPRGGPHTLRNSLVAFNDNTGVYISMASNTHILDNLVVFNGGGGTNVEGEPKNTQLLFKFRDHPQGPKSAEDWQHVRITGNTFTTASADGHLFDYLERNAEPRTQYARVLGVLESDHNRYETPTESLAFRAPDGSWLSLSGWRNLLDEHNAPGGREAASHLDTPSATGPPHQLFTPDADDALSRLALARGIPLPAATLRAYWQRVDAGLYQPPHLHFERQDD